MTAPLMQRWRRFSNSPIAKHCTGVVALFLILCAVSTQVAIDWHTADSSGLNASADAPALDALVRSNAPFRGAAARISRTENAIDAFYVQRIPATYSQISFRIIELGAASGVQLSHLAYDQRSRGSYLTELSVESQVSGTYPQIMRFLNGLERDKTCFVIRAMTLTGQQGGEVNLQLRFSVWLRPAGDNLPQLTSAMLEHGSASSSQEND